MEDDKVKMMEDVAQKLKEINELDKLETLLQTNTNEFAFNDKHYRIRRPNSIDKEQANKERMKKYFSMLKDPDYLFRQQLEALYKTKGIDIPAIENEIKGLTGQEKELYKKLNRTQDPSDIEILEKEIFTIRQKQQSLFFEKEEYLKYCIEKQLDDYVRFYLIYLLLETKNQDKWEKVYKSFNEFMQAPDEMLQAKAVQAFMTMVYYENV